MAWFDEYFQEDTPADSGGADAAADIYANLGDDLAEAVQMALGDNAGQDWVGGITNTAAYAQRQGVNDAAPKAVAPDTPKEGGILGKITGFVEKNKALSEMLIKGVAGAAAGNQAKKTAEIQARNRLDELKLKNQQDMEKDARTSASVSGLRAPTGIINRNVLRRTDGTPVYQNGRIV